MDPDTVDTLDVLSDIGNPITAWAYRTRNNIFFPSGNKRQEQVTIHRNQGLGVFTDGNNNDANNQINNQRKNEFLVLQLPTTSWTTVSITLTNVRGGRENDGRDDYRIYGALGGAISEVGGGLVFSSDPADYVLLAEGQGPRNDASNHTLFLELAGLRTEFVIAVADNRRDDNERQNDGFRVSAFQGVQISEPGTIALLGIGFVGMAIAARRRRKGA